MKNITMTAESVRGILAVRKTQTRRVMNPQPIMDEHGMWSWKDCQWMDGGIGFPRSGVEDHAPYKVGDVLYVKETWCEFVPEHTTMIGAAKYAYKADATPDGEMARQDYVKRGYPYKWRSPRYMPKAAARIFLRVTGARVQRLQEISDEDAEAEGCAGGRHEPKVCNPCIYGYGCPGNSALDEYVGLWERLNAKRGYPWEKNPWVWVYTFERVEKPERYGESQC